MPHKLKNPIMDFQLISLNCLCLIHLLLILDVVILQIKICSLTPPITRFLNLDFISIPAFLSLVLICGIHYHYKFVLLNSLVLSANTLRRTCFILPTPHNSPVCWSVFMDYDLFTAPNYDSVFYALEYVLNINIRAI